MTQTYPVVYMLLIVFQECIDAARYDQQSQKYLL